MWGKHGSREHRTSRLISFGRVLTAKLKTVLALVTHSLRQRSSVISGRRSKTKRAHSTPKKSLTPWPTFASKPAAASPPPLSTRNRVYCDDTTKRPYTPRRRFCTSSATPPPGWSTTSPTPLTGTTFGPGPTARRRPTRGYPSPPATATPSTTSTATRAWGGAWRESAVVAARTRRDCQGVGVVER